MKKNYIIYVITCLLISISALDRINCAAEIVQSDIPLAEQWQNFQKQWDNIRNRMIKLQYGTPASDFLIKHNNIAELYRAILLKIGHNERFIEAEISNLKDTVRNIRSTICMDYTGTLHRINDWTSLLLEFFNLFNQMNNATSHLSTNTAIIIKGFEAYKSQIKLIRYLIQMLISGCNVNVSAMLE